RWRRAADRMRVADFGFWPEGEVNGRPLVRRLLGGKADSFLLILSSSGSPSGAPLRIRLASFTRRERLGRFVQVFFPHEDRDRLSSRMPVTAIGNKLPISRYQPSKRKVHTRAANLLIGEKVYGGHHAVI